MAKGLPDWYSWVQVIQSMTFLELDDTPGTFIGQALKVCRVDLGETAIEFTPLNPAVDHGSIQGLADDDHPQYKKDSISATDKLLGRQAAGAGAIEEIALTAAGRNLIDDASVAAQLITLAAVKYGKYQDQNGVATLFPGIKLQFGRVFLTYANESEKSKTITFPESFDNYVLALAYCQLTGMLTQFVCFSVSSDKTQATFYAKTRDGGNVTGTEIFSWIALGC